MLDLSSTEGHTFGGPNTRVIFLDEFRMMVLAPNITPLPEFTLFDTLVPRNHPVGSRRFRLPPKYRGWLPIVYVDSDRCFETLARDRPLTTDPTQAVFVMKLAIPSQPRVLLIVRIQPLIDHVDSMSTDACVSWDEWGRSAVVMEVPEGASVDRGPYLLVQGVHVTWVMMFVTPGVDGCPHPHLCTFDFGRRGWSTLPLRDEGNGTERGVSFEDGRHFLLLQGNPEMSGLGLDSLGDGRLMYLVSRSCCWKSSGILMPRSGQPLWFGLRVARLGADLRCPGVPVPPDIT